MSSHRPRRLSSLILAVILAGISWPVLGAVPPWRSALVPAGSGGLEALDRGLARLSVHQRLLIIAAHPDDEDTTLLTLVSRGLGGEAAYLSLSRGEGGQNLIGPELGVGLGLIRSRELMAARERDGARQFFTRAFDFGYTRSLEETFERWPKEVLLEDVTRVIRRFKPQVVVAIFPPDARAGHGQHQASGVVAEEAIARAAAQERLDHPWQVEAFYRSAWFDRESATLELPLGVLEPTSGRSILQVALDSRSQHRSQDMGLEQPLGDAMGRLRWESGARGEASDGPFSGIDTRLEAMAGLLEGTPARPGLDAEEVGGKLRRVRELAVAAREGLSPTRPRSAVEPLTEIIGILGEIHADLTDALSTSAAWVPNRSHLHDLVAEKLTVARESLAAAAQISVDAFTDREILVPGQILPVRTQLWNAGGLPIEEIGVRLESEAGWEVGDGAAAEPIGGRFAARVTDERLTEATVPPDARPTYPYFLTRPLRGDLYDWSDVGEALQGMPFEPPPLEAVFTFRLGGQEIELRREVVFRTRDQALGEVRRPLRAVPALEVRVSPPLSVVSSLGDRRVRARVEVRSNQEAPQRGRLELVGAEGWAVPELPRFALAGIGDRKVFELDLRLPESLEQAQAFLRFKAVSEDGRSFGWAYPLVDYPHIRPTPMPVLAEMEVQVTELQLPSLERVGYVRGASDRVPEMLQQLGLPLEILDAETLSGVSLGSFDVIVIGSRAYETDPALAAANARLLDYARGGGLLIVQYQQYQFVRGGFAPFPLDIDRPHDRITDELAPVTLLAPEHRVFHQPNRITQLDWMGWMQERGLYFAGSWDEAYRPLMAMPDHAGEAQHGGLLVAELGEGTYVYTGLAFFRQLPAGVPGAFRLFANLLALGGR